MTYRAPIADIAFTLRHSAGLKQMLEEGLYGDLTDDVIDAVLEEAGKFATDVIAPLNRVGDSRGTLLKDGSITMPPGWKETYSAWTRAGWNGLAGPAEFGGQGLPHLLNAACIELWNEASMAFGIGPILTMGALEALANHGSELLKGTYLAKLVSGEWMATMNLTEPQAGSDLAALRTKADRATDGTYRITGQKIFITYGEHDLTDNIIHFVLARLPDAPPGTKGISLFLVPKFLLNPDGSIGARNDVRCHSIEHKLGIHGSPTCTMVYGDKGGAVGFLVGEENRGLACMFTMMNNARLAVGLQGVAIAERATQQALAYARERRQGRANGATGAAMSPIIEHPDVKRMLLTMRAMTKAARAICYMTATAIDRSHRASDSHARRAADERASLLTPVAKAFSTDAGVEVSSLGVQVHGGMGYIEETGAAQHFRDARIAAIYEGTNGIQAIDLVTRKLPVRGGESVREYLGELRKTVSSVRASNNPAFGGTATRLDEAIDSLDRATNWLLAQLEKSPQAALCGATPYLRMFAHAAGGCALAEEALAALRLDGTADASQEAAGRIATARFFAENVATASPGLEQVVTGGAASIEAADAVLAL
ncbi:MAG TPA: acyl-CoA dehydrogenase [Xanthobacteraceae bacterium]|jgi:butyryl-CoA dehydrogenase|nr:acyl-CoA dehydrogenase [Xanthobacteraceae bacterium]